MFSNAQPTLIDRLQAAVEGVDSQRALTNLHRLLLATLLAHGLKDTADCLRAEAAVDETSTAANSAATSARRGTPLSTYRTPLSTHRSVPPMSPSGDGPGMSRSATAPILGMRTLQKGPLTMSGPTLPTEQDVDEAEQIATQQRRCVFSVAAHVAEYRQRIAVMTEKLRQIREARVAAAEQDLTNADAIRTKQLRLADLEKSLSMLRTQLMPLQTRLEGQNDKVRTLKVQLEQRRFEEDQKQERLRRARSELEQLRLRKTQRPRVTRRASAAPPPPIVQRFTVFAASLADVKKPPPDAPEGERLKWMLDHWDESHGIHSVAPHLFSQADRDKNGKLTWNDGEIKQFVKDLFQHYDLHVPPWQDSIWYEVYRQCDQDTDNALELYEVMFFAKHIFELYHHSFEVVHDEHGYNPLGHGFKDEALAGTLQSILASALNAQRGGILYNTVIGIFNETDSRFTGGHPNNRIDWNSREVRYFIERLFQCFHVSMPQWQEQAFYEMYQQCDIESRMSLSLPEALELARKCFQQLLDSLKLEYPRPIWH